VEGMISISKGGPTPRRVMKIAGIAMTPDLERVVVAFSHETSCSGTCSSPWSNCPKFACIRLFATTRGPGSQTGHSSFSFNPLQCVQQLWSHSTNVMIGNNCIPHTLHGTNNSVMLARPFSLSLRLGRQKRWKFFFSEKFFECVGEAQKAVYPSQRVLHACMTLPSAFPCHFNFAKNFFVRPGQGHGAGVP